MAQFERRIPREMSIKQGDRSRATVFLPDDLADPIYTAIHEAGHAVAYISHGCRFRYVTIRARNQIYSGGHVYPNRALIDPKAKATITVAGPAAERYFILMNDYEQQVVR
jgi:hypothetical protein